MQSRLAPRPRPRRPALLDSAPRGRAPASACPSNCTSPRSTMRSCAHAIAGRPTIASVPQQRRPQLELPRQAGLGAVRRSARSSRRAGPCRSPSTVVTRRSSAPRRRRARCSAAGTAAAPGSRRAADRVASASAPSPSPSTVNVAQPRPPLAVAVGVRQRRPELRRASPRSATPGRSGTATAPHQLRRRVRPVQAAGASAGRTRAVADASLEAAEVERDDRAPHRGRAGDVHADEDRGDVVEVLRRSRRPACATSTTSSSVARCCTLRGARSRREQPHHHEHDGEEDHDHRAVHARDVGDAQVEARRRRRCLPPPLCGPAPVTTVPVTSTSAGEHEQHAAERDRARA